MSRRAIADTDSVHTIWQPETDIARRLTLAAILHNNPLPIAYRLNYLANFYVGPLIKRMEQELGMTRPEWIVLFCLTRRSGLSAQQISDVTGRPKTSISAAVKQLQRKRLLSRSVDAKDGRRRVLQITEAGQRTYAKILQGFVARESDLVACLSRSERSTFLQLLNKLIDNSTAWARSY
ncbi:MAG: winged helix DNA-binding protein [Rhodospirillales bacterium]|nr:winged helix DNA-binding protein [Rhodospirillales bacterium]